MPKTGSSRSPEVPDPFRRRHSSATARDRRGNYTHITEFGSSQCGTRPCNLHSAWDFGLIEHKARSEEQYTSDLEQLILCRHLQSQAGAAPASWANESFRIAKED